MKIEFIDVTKTLKGSKVINGVSLTLNSGIVTGFSGINGSGKTMMMRLVAGLIYPTAGKILVDDKEMGREIPFPENLGLLIEKPAFINNYSGLDNLLMLASIRGLINKDDVLQTLSTVGLFEHKDKKFKKYSLGMKQRLGIAAAIMERPRVLLLDEPTNSLDESGVQMVKDIIQAEKERGAAVIVACHDSSILKSVTDEIYYLESGEVKRIENKAS